MFKVLTVCTGNICRSPMAEAFLTQMLTNDLKHKVSVSSAGTHAIYGYPAEPFACQAAEYFGCNLDEHRSQTLSKEMVKTSNLVLVMEPRQVGMIKNAFLFGKVAVKLLSDFDPDRELKEIKDPYGKSLDVYLQCASDIVTCLEVVLLYLRRKLNGV
jgi:protein-tyrosine-phosphatase